MVDCPVGVGTLGTGWYWAVLTWAACRHGPSQCVGASIHHSSDVEALWRHMENVEMVKFYSVLFILPSSILTNSHRSFSVVYFASPKPNINHRRQTSFPIVACTAPTAAATAHRTSPSSSSTVTCPPRLGHSRGPKVAYNYLPVSCLAHSPTSLMRSSLARSYPPEVAWLCLSADLAPSAVHQSIPPAPSLSSRPPVALPPATRKPATSIIPLSPISYKTIPNLIPPQPSRLITYLSPPPTYCTPSPTTRSLTCLVARSFAVAFYPEIDPITSIDNPPVAPARVVRCSLPSAALGHFFLLLRSSILHLATLSSNRNALVDDPRRLTLLLHC